MSACQTKTLFKGFLLALDLRDLGALHSTASLRKVFMAELAGVSAMCKKIDNRQAFAPNRSLNRPLPVIYWESG
jgi:hypothetical protein